MEKTLGFAVVIINIYKPKDSHTQDKNTRSLISKVKETIEPKGMYIVSRFAEWEYYNMDVAMGAALDLTKRIVADNEG